MHRRCRIRTTGDDDDDGPHGALNGNSPNGKATAIAAAEAEAQKREASKSVVDFTRNIQRKKDRELAELQFTPATGTTRLAGV